MATTLMNTVIGSLVQSGVLGLSTLFGSHTTASQQAAMPIAMIMAHSNNPAVVVQNAQLIANMFANTNPAAAATAMAIVANPAAALQLIGSLKQDIDSQSNSMMRQLAHAVSGTTLTVTGS